jgi:hypothetical protein
MAVFSPGFVRQCHGVKQLPLTELVPEELQPPMALDAFIERMGISRRTAWMWRKKNLLRTVNIYGRIYVPAKEIAEFNRRAAAGEFSQEHKTPTRGTQPAKHRR